MRYLCSGYTFFGGGERGWGVGGGSIGFLWGAWGIGLGFGVHVWGSKQGWVDLGFFRAGLIWGFEVVGFSPTQTRSQNPQTRRAPPPPPQATHLREPVGLEDHLSVLLAEVLGDLAVRVHGRQVGGVGDVGAQAQLAGGLLGDDLVVAWGGLGFGGG